MKAYLPLLLLSPFSLSSAYGQAESDYTNWVRQIQYEENQHGQHIRIVRDKHVPKEGVGDSVIGIPENGALFQLWTINNIDPSQVWKLDTATVGAFGPRAEIVITAEDSYAGRPRTRADRPFQVDYQVKGIAVGFNDAEVPVDLSKVRSIHHVDSTDATTNSGEFLIFNDEVITRNGKRSLSFANTNIRSDDPTQAHKVMGREIFSVEGFTDVESERVIETKSIDIFPVPSGVIEGLVNNEVLRSLPSALRVIVNDAYPGSEVYLEVVHYPNGPDENVMLVMDAHSNTPITNSEDSKYTLANFSRYNPDVDSIVITRLVSKSIFGLEILAESSNKIDRDLIVRGSINSL